MGQWTRETVEGHNGMRESVNCVTAVSAKAASVVYENYVQHTSLARKGRLVQATRQTTGKQLYSSRQKHVHVQLQAEAFRGCSSRVANSLTHKT